MNDPFLFKRDGAAELFLIRHGDAIPGPDEIILSGIYDNLPLSKSGRQQAQALAERLKEGRFDALYSSPLRRCQETAAPLVKYLGLVPVLVEEIKEIRLGELRPMPVPEPGASMEALTNALQARQIDVVNIAASSGNWDSIPDTEPSRAFRQRVVAAINAIACRHHGQRVLVFAHGGVINAYAAEALGLEKDFFFPCANTSITVVRSTGSHHALYVLNDVGHLKL